MPWSRKCGELRARSKSVFVPVCAVAGGIGSVYVVRATSGVVLVDTGQPGKTKALLRGLDAAGVVPSEVKLIVITHGHWDHMGCAADLKRVAGAPVAMHQAETERLERSLKVTPPGVTPWGRIFGRVLGSLVMPFVRIPPATVDIPVSDDGLSLEPYGVAGQVLHTPGHTPGSLSVLLDTGDAIVGDLAMNGLPLRIGPGLPIFAEDLPRLRGSIELLLDRGARTIHPGHGAPFRSEVLARALRELGAA